MLLGFLLQHHTTMYDLHSLFMGLMYWYVNCVLYDTELGQGEAGGLAGMKFPTLPPSLYPLFPSILPHSQTPGSLVMWKRKRGRTRPLVTTHYRSLV